VATSTNDPVTARFWLEIFDTPHDEGGQVEVELEYRPEDPYAIKMTFLNENTVWVFSRDLLRIGILDHVGMADVQIWPSPSHVYIRLEAGMDQWIVFRTSLRRVRDFVNRMYQAVPEGQESGWLNLDFIVNRLLQEG
jgi:Streptomyces sporulation and cell division protein, SsgA